MIDFFGVGFLSNAVVIGDARSFMIFNKRCNSCNFVDLTRFSISWSVFL